MLQNKDINIVMLEGNHLSFIQGNENVEVIGKEIERCLNKFRKSI